MPDRRQPGKRGGVTVKSTNVREWVHPASRALLAAESSPYQGDGPTRDKVAGGRRENTAKERRLLIEPRKVVVALPRQENRVAVVIENAGDTTEPTRDRIYYSFGRPATRRSARVDVGKQVVVDTAVSGDELFLWVQGIVGETNKVPAVVRDVVRNG